MFIAPTAFGWINHLASLAWLSTISQSLGPMIAAVCAFSFLRSKRALGINDRLLQLSIICFLDVLKPVVEPDCVSAFTLLGPSIAELSTGIAAGVRTDEA